MRSFGSYARNAQVARKLNRGGTGRNIRMEKMAPRAAGGAFGCPPLTPPPKKCSKGKTRETRRDKTHDLPLSTDGATSLAARPSPVRVWPKKDNTRYTLPAEFPPKLRATFSLNSVPLYIKECVPLTPPRPLCLRFLMVAPHCSCSFRSYHPSPLWLRFLLEVSPFFLNLRWGS